MLIKIHLPGAGKPLISPAPPTPTPASKKNKKNPKVLQRMQGT